LQFGGSDDSGSDFDDNGSSLPFPKPLARSAFLVPNFDPTTFLANLSGRYQTLDDLRNELRELSQSLSKELLDLVNDNYQDFLSLGSTLRGGEERVEEVRVGLLGFQRDLISVRDTVEQRETVVAALISKKRNLMKDIRTGKSLLEIAEKLEDLETSLMIGSGAGADFDGMNRQAHDFSEESDEDAQEGELSIHRLERHTEQYLVLRLLLRRHNPTQPFITSQASRVARIESTLTLDLKEALKQLEVSAKRGRPETASSIRIVQELLNSITKEILQ
jgi:conserved oligomeric Golgi complex subunit 2